MKFMTRINVLLWFFHSMKAAAHPDALVSVFFCAIGSIWIAARWDDLFPGKSS